MSRIVVDAEGVGKKYYIRHRGLYGYVALRDVLSEGPGRLLRRAARRQRPGEGATREELWAVRDASFQLSEGDRLGLIGRNGAGKSTLLKILSRITEPTTGRVTLRGRVASLLEVGTGFHPELTGRENVYLNGTILGMHRSEIQRKFDEIVAFAEVERFLDTPVKRYSSGMYVRLAFAVAAHLEQEILLVDEVLAVGDAAFQKKCLAKMGEVAREEGRTIILVSHNLVAIEQLCTDAIWMEGGRIVDNGRASEVVERYNGSFAASARGGFDSKTVMGDGTVELKSYEVTNETGTTSPLPVTGEDVVLNVEMNVRERIARPAAGISVWSPTGVLLVSVDTGQLGQELDAWEPGERTMTIRLGKVPFLPGTHRVDFWVQAPGGHLYAHVEDAITFEIGQSALYGTSYVDRGFGCVFTSVDVSARSSEEHATPEPAGVGPGVAHFDPAMADLRVSVARPSAGTDATLAFIAESLGLRLRTTPDDPGDPPHLVVGEPAGDPGTALIVPARAGDRFWADLLEGRICGADLAGRLPFDLVGAIEAFLTDAVNADTASASLDGHDRLAYGDSGPARAGYGDRPIVNDYVAALGEALRASHGLVGEARWPSGKRAAIALSHDVDQPDRYALLRSAVRPWRFRRHPRSYLRGALRLARERLRDPDPADSWVWREVAESEAAHGFRSTFFVATTPFHHARGADVDVAYDVGERRFRPVLRKLENGGFEVGLHAGYRAFEDASWMADERARLGEIVGREIDGVRHHFWHLGPDPAATLRSHEAAGFRHDSSLAFNDHVGFRRSVALPFRPWDPVLGRPLSTLQLPTFCMDGNLLYGSDDVDAAVATVGQLVDTIVAAGGIGSIDWHIQASVPRTPVYRHWGVAYQRILAGLAARDDVWVTSHREIERWTRDRAARIEADPGPDRRHAGQAVA